MAEEKPVKEEEKPDAIKTDATVVEEGEETEEKVTVCCKGASATLR